jgi:hypothetical protein|tara:strand:+ start:222 stop:635 length:414 start_codon:yes stop_codon:yes gene_type:complete
VARKDHIILEITSLEKEIQQDPFVDYSLKVKKYLEVKATEVKGVGIETLIKVFKSAARDCSDINYCAARINNFLEVFSDYKNFKTAVANNFEPSEECLATAKVECKDHGIDEIEFEDVDQFYLETKDEFKNSIDIEI